MAYILPLLWQLSAFLIKLSISYETLDSEGDMSNTSQYSFEVLPCHPPPERLETFCSYVTRLAEANYVNSMPKWHYYFSHAVLRAQYAD
jgi:hypothetical protein